MIHVIHTRPSSGQRFAVGLRQGCLVLLGMFLLLFAAYRFVFPHYMLAGPTSPGGMTVEASVRDCGPGWSSDFYTDVTILDPQGKPVATWKDRQGQYPRGGPEKLVNSMVWITSRKLRFKSNGRWVELEVP